MIVNSLLLADREEKAILVARVIFVVTAPSCGLGKILLLEARPSAMTHTLCHQSAARTIVSW